MFIIEGLGFKILSNSLRKGFSHLPGDARDEGLIPGQGTKTPRGKGQLSPAPQPESPHAASGEPAGCSKRPPMTQDDPEGCN